MDSGTAILGGPLPKDQKAAESTVKLLGDARAALIMIKAPKDAGCLSEGSAIEIFRIPRPRCHNTPSAADGTCGL